MPECGAGKALRRGAQVRQGCSGCQLRCAYDHLGRKDRPQPEGQTHRRPPGQHGRHLVGQRQHQDGPARVRDQSRTGDRLPEYTRTAVRLRRLCRMGPSVPAEGARHLLPPVPRALHAQHADPADRGRARRLRRARLHHLQRRQLSRQSLHDGHDLADERLSQLRAPRDGHPRHGIRRRDEKGRLYSDELPDAQSRHPLDALLGQRGRQRRRLPVFRALRHRQDHPVGRPETQADRRRRALLERPGHLQHRRGVLRQGHQPVSGEGAPDLRRDPLRSPRTPAPPIRSSSFRTPRYPAWEGTRKTSSS